MGNIEIIKLSYHRNGVSGYGFYVATFNYHDGVVNHHMVGIIYPDDLGYCSVLDIDELKSDNIEFAGGNSWRGDNFEGELREAIEAYQRN